MASVPWGSRAPLSGATYSAVEIADDGGAMYLLDQLALPDVHAYRTVTTCAGAARAIRDMVVRGAPAIGITAAYGMVLAARAEVEAAPGAYLERLAGAGHDLVSTRPTAVNLAWAVDRCLIRAREHAAEAGEARWRDMLELARAIHRDDVAACRAMGRAGAARLPEECTVLTHCNAGALATGGYGTALGVIRAAVEAGKRVRVLACETRPFLQGARLTAWELAADGVPVTLITDSMAGHCMATGRVDAVVVGADRIARNGDVANKIGTYALACLARVHELPFFVAAPWSTVDVGTRSGADIPIEERAAGELSQLHGRRLAPEGVPVYNPAFDVTPARLIEAIFTERGAHRPAEIAAVGETTEAAGRASRDRSTKQR